MGLFDKKYCDICGEKIGLLGNRKLEDGNLCKNCAKKLSPWFDERRHSTVDQIRQQLNYREENKAKVAAFHATSVIGRDSTKLYIDDRARKFAVHKGNDFETANPDILDFSQALGCDLDIREDRDEIRRTVDGRSESYNPPRYEYSYDFKVTIRVDHPYFNEMTFDLNGRAVRTGETQMAGGGFGSWNVSRVGSFFGHSVGMNEYNEFIQMGNTLKETIDSWRNGAPAANSASSQGETILFGSKNPVPMDALVGNQRVSLGINYSGKCEIAAPNPAVVQNFGGIDALKSKLFTEILIIGNDAVHNFGIQCLSFNDLVAKTGEINNYMKLSLEQRWADTYGLTLNAVSIDRLTLTEDSQRIVDQIQQTQSAQAFNQQPTQGYVQQPVQPQASSAVCPFCGTPNPGKYCPNCGAKQ